MLKLHIKMSDVNGTVNMVMLKERVKATLPCKTRIGFYPAL